MFGIFSRFRVHVDGRRFLTTSAQKQGVDSDERNERDKSDDRDIAISARAETCFFFGSNFIG